MGIAIAIPSGMLCKAIANAILSPRVGDSIALTNVAMPSGKLCTAITTQDRMPTRNNFLLEWWLFSIGRFLPCSFFFSPSRVCSVTSWGFSSPGTNFAIIAIRPFPPKTSRKVHMYSLLPPLTIVDVSYASGIHSSHSIFIFTPP